MNTPVLATRTIPAKWTTAYKLTLHVEGGLCYLKGNPLPYFSLTCWKHRKGHPDQCQSGGADHETILKYYPQFADLAALHLSDINGVPMHAEANGWYQLTGALPDNAGERYHAGNSKQNFPKQAGAPRRGEWDNTDYRNPTPDECLQAFAEHARVSVETARALRDRLVEVWQATREQCEPIAQFADVGIWAWSGKSWAGTRKEFGQWIDAQRPRWKQEAEACIARHGLRVYGDEWKGETGR